MESNPLASYVYFCLKDLKVDLPYKGIVELYAKIFYTSSWINFLTTYSKFKVFSDVNFSLAVVFYRIWFLKLYATPPPPPIFQLGPVRMVEFATKFPNRGGFDRTSIFMGEVGCWEIGGVLFNEGEGRVEVAIFK